jgi:hypothetical protein
MKKPLLKVFSIVWVVFVTPLFGLLPLLVVVTGPGTFVELFGVALLRDVRGLFLADPAPNVSHLSLYELAPEAFWWLVIPIVFFITALALFSFRLSRQNLPVKVN